MMPNERRAEKKNRPFALRASHRYHENELIMSRYEQILSQIRSDERYQNNLDWGEPRSGHPEGSVRCHIDELEINLGRLKSRLSEDDVAKLRILVHTHDTFKAESKRGVPISHPRSHSSLAKEFLAQFTDESDLLDIVQLHDEPYALWRKFLASGRHEDRLLELIDAIADWNLFLAFLIIDGCTKGKTREPLIWFFDQVQDRVDSHVTIHWLI